MTDELREIAPGVFEGGNPGGAVVLPRHITPVAFRNRFSSSEKARLELAATDNPQAQQADRLAAAALRASLRDVESASYIDLDRADIRARVQALEAAGLLDAAGRASAILDAEVEPGERP